MGRLIREATPEVIQLVRDLNSGFLVLDYGSPRFKSCLLQKVLPDTHVQAVPPPGSCTQALPGLGGRHYLDMGLFSPWDCEALEGKARTTLVPTGSSALPSTGLEAESVTVAKSVSSLLGSAINEPD